MKPTGEQVAVCNASQRGESFIIEARAGAGKTTTLKLIIEILLTQGTRILYLTYNTSIAEEAREKLPSTPKLTIKTIHGLAYKYIGKKYKHKLGDLTLRNYRDILDINDWSLTKTIQTTLENFINSDDTYLAAKHVPPDISRYSKKHELIVRSAQSIWEMMQDVNSPVKMSHEGYLKLFTLECGQTLNQNYDAILVDEAQDQGLNVIQTLKLFKHQLIIVGDSAQQLYGYRNAKNALNKFDLPKYYLTKSFRFGDNLANAATALLLEKGMKKNEARILGNSQIMTKIYKPYTKLNQPRTILTRSVLGALSTAFKLHQAGATFALNGGIESYISNDLIYVERLIEGKTNRIPERFLKNFPTFQSVLDYVDKTSDSEMARIVKMTTEISSVSELIEDIKRTEKRIKKEMVTPYFTISTTHRAKGQEFKYVVLSNDFPTLSALNSPKLPAERRHEELNILYVGLTRAINGCVINESIHDIIINANKRFASN